jgi:hypothetical protein
MVKAERIAAHHEPGPRILATKRRPQNEAPGWTVYPAVLYRHTQRGGTLIMFVRLVLAALDAAITFRSGRWLPVAARIILIAVAFLFSSLTVEVNGGELRWHFGLGFWTYRLAVDAL